MKTQLRCYWCTQPIVEKSDGVTTRDRLHFHNEPCFAEYKASVGDTSSAVETYYSKITDDWEESFTTPNDDDDDLSFLFDDEEEDDDDDDDLLNWDEIRWVVRQQADPFNRQVYEQIRRNHQQIAAALDAIHRENERVRAQRVALGIKALIVLAPMICFSLTWLILSMVS